MTDIKLVAIDVDGTLLTDEHELTEHTKNTILKLKDKGIQVILASGRGPTSCIPFVNQLNLTEPLITHNGAVIYHPVTGEVEKEIGFEAQELLPFIEYCREHQIQFDLNTALDMYVEQSTPEAEKVYEIFYINPTRVEDSSQLDEQIVKFTITGQQEQLDDMMQKLAPQFPNWSIIRSGETFIDIIHPKATKGFALQHILKEKNIQPEEVLAFGNYFNDVEMLQLAGTGVAMGNAPDGVKAKADRIAPPNNEEGVAAILQEYLK
ncbi:HAD family hydrolase [Caldalkalibacillus salinus]|uniref:HAD family hydrolase n=1 Tax=Caldalkalibacillus salinus TaxID=2803787 RepID=UPI001923F735|nr:HAD family hydrolase [Caldalkalibacillus salinus]